MKERGCIETHCKVKITGSKYQMLPLLRSFDHDDIEQIAGPNNFDYVVIPCVQTGKDVQEARIAVTEHAPKCKIVVKIDTLEALHQFEGIVKHADGVVIHRRELCNELEAQKMMLAQKWIIQRCNQEGKPVFLQS